MDLTLRTLIFKGVVMWWLLLFMLVQLLCTCMVSNLHLQADFLQSHQAAVGIKIQHELKCCFKLQL